jgi:hypothetical protein
MSTKRIKASSRNTDLARRDETISDIVDSSKIVIESIKAYNSAPGTIKNSIDEIKIYEYNRIYDMFSSTMKQPIEPAALDKLATVAAVETVRSSPIFIGLVKEFAEEKRLPELIEFTNWTDKYMTNAVRNLITFKSGDTNKESHFDGPDVAEDKHNERIDGWLYERYFGSSDDAKGHNVGLELNDWLIERVNALDDAIKTVGTKRRVLMAIGKGENEIEMILERESHRLMSEKQKGIHSLDASDAGINDFKNFLRMLRESEKEVMHNASEN